MLFLIATTMALTTRGQYFLCGLLWHVRKEATYISPLCINYIPLHMSESYFRPKFGGFCSSLLKKKYIARFAIELVHEKSTPTTYDTRFWSHPQSTFGIHKYFCGKGVNCTKFSHRSNYSFFSKKKRMRLHLQCGNACSCSVIFLF